MSNSIEQLDIWRLIPPEEKLLMMSKAQGQGLWAAFVAVLVGGTLAVALQMPALLWVGLLSTPIVYQFTSGKKWRAVKPETVLRYMAARSAARRHAFNANSKELNLQLIFRGTMQKTFDARQAERLDKQMESMIKESPQIPVWISLFDDVVIVMSERIGGAAIEFAHEINDKLEIIADNPSGGDYDSNKTLTLGYSEKIGSENLSMQIKLTSQFPGALVVFEKTLGKIIREFIDKRDGATQVVKEEQPKGIAGVDFSFNDD